MANTKRRGDRGSPCLRPWPYLIGSLGTPLRSTLDEDDQRRADIQSLKFFFGGGEAKMLKQIH
jgi:hypothetical protein